MWIDRLITGIIIAGSLALIFLFISGGGMQQ